MMSNPANRRPLHRLGQITVYLVLGIAIWYRILSAHPPKPPATRFSAAQMRQQALLLASSFGGPFTAAESVYSQKNVAIWSVTCHSRDMDLRLAFDDTTGRLWELSLKPDESVLSPRRASVATPAAAKAVALRRLQDLRLATPGSKLRLERPPTRLQFTRNWQMDWNVQPPGGAAPEHIHLLLDQKTGLPLTLYASWGTTSIPHLRPLSPSLRMMQPRTNV